MSFSIPMVIVANATNPVASTGSAANLAAGQIAAYAPTNLSTPVTTIGNSEAIQLFQGKLQGELNGITRRSDKIYPRAVIRIAKIEANDDRSEKILTVTGLAPKCGEQYTFTVRTKSQNINVSHNPAHGMINTYVINGPCCDCGDDPCEEVSAEDIYAEFVSRANADLGKYITFAVSTDEDDAVVGITATGVAQPDIHNPNNLSIDQYTQDFVDFNIYVTKGANSTLDEIVQGACETAATVTVTQEIVRQIGSGKAVKQIEYKNFSYQNPKFKSTFCRPEYNVGYVSNVNESLFYDEYQITFFEPNAHNLVFSDNANHSEMVRLFVPTGTASTAVEAWFTSLGFLPTSPEGAMLAPEPAVTEPVGGDE